MSTNKSFELEQNESYALIDWKESNLIQGNYEELEQIIRILFKKEYSNIILNISKIDELDGYGVSTIRKGTKICSNESGLFVIVTKKENILERLEQANIENITLFNTVQEGIDAIYLNELENDFSENEEEDEFGGSENFSDYSDDY
ncbi:STAS domain-containing protein [Aquirufa sp. ROCK-SH2]